MSKNKQKMKVSKCIIYQRPMHTVPLKQGRDFSWDEIMKHKSIKPFSECVPVSSDHPLYILYTSGTTGLKIQTNKQTNMNELNKHEWIETNKQTCIRRKWKTNMNDMKNKQENQRESLEIQVAIQLPWIGVWKIFSEWKEMMFGGYVFTKKKERKKERKKHKHNNYIIFIGSFRFRLGCWSFLHFIWVFIIFFFKKKKKTKQNKTKTNRKINK